VRRGSGNPLYRRVLERYIHMATAGGVTQAVYPEGGLSKDGRLRPAKLGLLDYMLRGFDPEGERDLVFIPVGINYDRVLEDRTLLLGIPPSEGAQREGPRKGPAEAAATTLRFALRNVGLMVRSRWYRFGYACVNFGSPISMRRYLTERGLDLRPLDRDERFAAIDRLGRELMARVGEVIPVLPVPLVATVLVGCFEEGGKALSELDLKARVHLLTADLERAGAHVYVPRRDQDYAVVAGLRALTLRHLVEERDGLYAARPEEIAVLRYYAHSIAHLRNPAAALA
jgi:glycerol-3-phosphate O-acyltransferase